MIENDLAALNNDDLSVGEGDVRDRSRPIIIWAARLLRRWIRRRRSGQTYAKISVFDFCCRKRLRGAWLNRDFVLSGSRGSAWIRADGGRAAAGFYRNGNIGVAETSEAEASFQLRPQIGEGWGAAVLEVNAGSIRDRRRSQRHEGGRD